MTFFLVFSFRTRSLLELFFSNKRVCSNCLQFLINWKTQGNVLLIYISKLATCKIIKNLACLFHFQRNKRLTRSMLTLSILIDILHLNILYISLLAMRTISSLLSPEAATISSGEEAGEIVAVERDSKLAIVRIVRK